MRLAEALQNPWTVLAVLFVVTLFSFRVDFLAVATQRFVGPAAFVTVLPEGEPAQFAACLAAGGICVPVEQIAADGRMDYGACDAMFKCTIKDLCVESGGRYFWDYSVLENTYFKRCECPLSKAYSLSDGCAEQFTSTPRMGGGSY